MIRDQLQATSEHIARILDRHDACDRESEHEAQGLIHSTLAFAAVVDLWDLMTPAARARLGPLPQGSS